MKDSEVYKVLNRIFSDKEIDILNNYTLKRIKEEFGELSFEINSRLLEINLAIMLKIGYFKANNLNINEVSIINKHYREKCMIEPDFKKFQEEYSIFIDKVIEYVKNKNLKL